MEAGRGNSWFWTAAGIGAVVGAAVVARKLSAYDLTGKTVVITGGSRGLGLVLAREFAAQRARLVLCARDAEALGRAREELAPASTEVLTIPCDVTDQRAVAQMITQATAHFGRIDVLVNNAGVIQAGPVEAMTLADYDEAMKTHFWGPLYTILAVLPQMRERRDGRIVNISSIGGKVAVPHLVPYSSSKFALVGLSEGLRAELAKDGIRVTTVCPGLMRTGSPRNAYFKGRHEEEYAWFKISDSLPGSSISAESAAHQIVAACRRGDAEIIPGLAAHAAAIFHGIFPGLTADLLGWVDRMLPAADGVGTARRRGSESESPLSESPLTALTDLAARRNNELERAGP